MKNAIKLIKTIGIVVCVLLMTACSDSDSGSQDNVYQGFKLKINGENQPIGTPVGGAFNSYPSMTLEGDVLIINMYLNSRTLLISFTKDGKFINARFSGSSLYYESFPHYTSHFFNFNLESFDPTNMTAKGTFAGQLYLVHSGVVYPDAEAMNIEGEFDLSYYDNTSPFVPQTYFMAKLDGVDWKPTKKIYDGVISNDPFLFNIDFLPNAELGTYTFDGTSTANRVEVGKYNLSAWQYDYFVTTGTLTITENTIVGGLGDYGYRYVGTFSFTAVNPNNPSEVYQITAGQYAWYKHV